MSLLHSTTQQDTTSKRIPALDLLRTIAITIVFFWHYRQHGSPEWVSAIGLFGWTGVDLFFVLSGYLIGGQLMQEAARGEGIKFKDFYLRRFFRIMPAYLAVLILYFSVPGFRERETIAPLWKFLTFTQNFGLDFSTGAAFSHAWSLCIEEQFYLLLPVLLSIVFAFRLRKLTPYLLLSLFLLGFVLRYYSWVHFVQPVLDNENLSGVAYFKWVYYPTYNRLDGLLAGVGIAALIQYRPVLWERIAGAANAMLAIGLLLLAAAYFLCSDLLTLRAAVCGYPLVSVAYGMIVMAAISPACILARINLRVFAKVATIAYCIYLTHKQLNHLVRALLVNYGMDDQGNTMFGICIVVAIAGGWVLHTAIEKPFLKLRKKILV